MVQYASFIDLYKIKMHCSLCHTGVEIHETSVSVWDYKDYVQSVFWAGGCPAALHARPVCFV